MLWKSCGWPQEKWNSRLTLFLGLQRHYCYESRVYQFDLSQVKSKVPRSPEGNVSAYRNAWTGS